MNCSYGPYKITTDLESIGNNMFKDSQESRRLVVFFDCGSVMSPCLDAVVLHRENNCPECDILWYECPSDMGRTYTLIATPCGVTITSFEDGLLASGLCDATQFGSKHFCFDAPDKSLVTFVFEGHTFTVQGNIGSCSPDLFECDECQSEETFEAFASLPTPPPDVSAPNFEEEEIASADDTPPTQIIPGEGRPNWRDEWTASGVPITEHDPDPDMPGVGVDTLCEDEKPLTDRPQGVGLPACDSNDNPSVATLPSGHIIVAHENRGENGLTKISLAILSSSVRADVRYHRTLSRGTLLNNLAETGGTGNFEVYDEIAISTNQDGKPNFVTRIGFLTGPMAGLIFLVTKFTRSVDKSRITNTFEFDTLAENFEFSDKNNVHDVQWFLLDDQGSEDLPPPNEDNVITTITLPDHLNSIGEIVPVANPSIAVARNNLMVQSEQVIYVTYQAYESNQWRVYLREIVLGGVTESPPTYVAPYLFDDNSQRQIEIMQLNPELTTFELGGSVWDYDFSTSTLQVRIGEDTDDLGDAEWHEIIDMSQGAGPWPEWEMWDSASGSAVVISDTSIILCSSSPTLPLPLRPCFPDDGNTTCIGVWNSFESPSCFLGAQQVPNFTRTMAKKNSSTLTGIVDFATTLRFATSIPLFQSVPEDWPEVWFWWGGRQSGSVIDIGEWRLQIIRGRGDSEGAGVRTQVSAGVSRHNIGNSPSIEQSVNCSDRCGASACFIFRLYDRFTRPGAVNFVEQVDDATFGNKDTVLREIYKCISVEGFQDYGRPSEDWNEWRIESYRRGRMRYFDIYLNVPFTNANDTLMARFREWDPTVFRSEQGDDTFATYTIGDHHGFGFAHGDDNFQIVVDRVKTDILLSPKIDEIRNKITLDEVEVEEGEIFYEDDMSWDTWINSESDRFSLSNGIHRAAHHLINYSEPAVYHSSAWDYKQMRFCNLSAGHTYYGHETNDPRPGIRGATASFESDVGLGCLQGDIPGNGIWSYTLITGSSRDLSGQSIVSNNRSMVLSVFDAGGSSFGWPHVWFVMRSLLTDEWWRSYRVRITKFIARPGGLAATTTPNGGSRPAIGAFDAYWKVSLYEPFNDIDGGKFDDPVFAEEYIQIVSESPGAGETTIDWASGVGDIRPYFRVDFTVENGVSGAFVRVKVYIGSNTISGDDAGAIGPNQVVFDYISYKLLHTFNTTSFIGGNFDRPYNGFALFSGSKADPELDGGDYNSKLLLNYIKVEKLPPSDPGQPIPLGACCRPTGECEDGPDHLGISSSDCLVDIIGQPDSIWVEGETCSTFDCTEEFPTGAACRDSGGDRCIQSVTLEESLRQGYGNCAGCGWIEGLDCVARDCPEFSGFGSCCAPAGCVSNLSFIDCSILFGNENPGIFWREDVNCPTQGGPSCPPSTDGSCCVFGDCQITDEISCIAQGGTFLGNNTNCTFGSGGSCVGACCILTDTCIETTEALCIETVGGGTFLGVGVSCTDPSNPCVTPPDIGACCFPNNTCQEIPDDACPPSATWLDGEPCYNCIEIAFTGACCNTMTGNCLNGITQIACEGSGDSYLGDASVCGLANCPQPVGACCINDVCNDDFTLLACVSAGGTYIGDHSECVLNICDDIVSDGDEDPYVFTGIIFKPEDLWRIETADEQYITRVKYHMQEEIRAAFLPTGDPNNLIDFMFAVDYSLGMITEIELIQQAVPFLSEFLTNKGFDVRFGFIIFGRGLSAAPTATVSLACGTSSVFNALQSTTSCRSSGNLAGSLEAGFTRSIPYLQQSMDCWGTGSGFTAPWATINFAINDSQFDWRTDSAKFIFFMSDTNNEESCNSLSDGLYLNDKAIAKTSLTDGPPGTTGGVQFIPAVSSDFVSVYEDVAADSGWAGDTFDVGASDFEPIFESIANSINTLLRTDNATIIERAKSGTENTHLKKGEVIISYDGDLTDLWTFNKVDFEFASAHVPFPGTTTKGVSGFPFDLATGKTYGIDSVHIQGFPDNWVSFGKEGPLNYTPSGFGHRASAMVDSPILISTNSTRPKVFVNNRNQVIVAYENYSSGTPQIEIKGTGDFHQDSITGPKASRIQRFVTPGDFSYRHAITLPGEGMNQICDFIVDNSDITHIVWQSNRDGFWEIYYANSFDLFSPVRITKSDNRSGHPSISVDDTGSIFVVYHDDRFGPFNIMLASKDEERIIPLLEQDAYMASLRNKYTHYTNILPVFIDNPSGAGPSDDPLLNQFWATKQASDPGNDSENMIYKISESSGLPSDGENLSTGQVAIAFSSTALFGVTVDGVLTKIGTIGDDNVTVAISPSVIGTIDLIRDGFENQEILDMDIDQFNRIWIMIYEEEIGGSAFSNTIRLLYISSTDASIVATGRNGIKFTLISVEDNQFGGLTITSDNKFYIIYHNKRISVSQVLRVSEYPIFDGSDAEFDFGSDFDRAVMSSDPGIVAMTSDAVNVLHVVSSGNDLYSINKADGVATFLVSLTTESGVEPALPVGTTSGIAHLADLSGANIDTEDTVGDQYFHIRIDFYDNIAFEGSPFLSVDSRDNLEAFINDEVLSDPYAIQGLTARGILVSPDIVGIVFFDATHFVPGFSRLSQPFSFEPNQAYFPRVFVIDETGNPRESGISQPNSFSCSKCSRFGNNNFNASACAYSFVVQNNQDVTRFYNFQIDFYADTGKQHLIRRFEATPGSNDLQYMEVNNTPAAELWTAAGLPVKAGDFPFIQIHPVLDPQAGFLCGVTYTVQVNDCFNLTEEECLDFSILSATNWFFTLVGETLQTIATDLQTIEGDPPALTSGFSMALVGDNLGIAWRSDDNNIMYTEFNGETWDTQTVFAPGIATYVSLASIQNQPAVHWTIQSGGFKSSAVAIFDGSSWNVVPGNLTESTTGDLPNPRNLIEFAGNPLVTYIGTGSSGQPSFLTTDAGAVWDTNLACGDNGSCLTDNAIVSDFPAVAYISSGNVTYAEWSEADETFSNIQNVSSSEVYQGHLGIAEINGQPAVAYIKVEGSMGRLAYARLNGSAWQETVVTGIMDFNKHVSMVNINDNPAIVYSVKQSSTTSQVRYATFNGSRFTNEIVDENLNIIDPMVSIIEFQNAPAVSVASNPFKLYLFRQKTDLSVRDILPVFFCECASKIFTNRLTHLNEVSRWEASAHGFADTRVTDSTEDSLRPVIKTRTSGAVIVLWEDENETENCLNPPCIRAATFRNTNQDQLRGSGTQSWFDYDFGISGQDPSLALDLYDRVNTVYEKAKPPDLVTGFHGNKVSKNELPSNELYRKVCDFAPSLSTTTATSSDTKCDISSLEANVITFDEFVSSKIVRKIKVKEAFVAYYTYNVSGILTPIVSSCNLELEIHGTPEIVALRLKNENSAIFGAWCAWSPQIGDFVMEKKHKISSGSGVKEICIQAMTYSGITTEFCIPIVADYETVVFQSKFYKNTDADGADIETEFLGFASGIDENLIELPLSEGISVASLPISGKGIACSDSSNCETNEICIGGICTPKTSKILIEIIPSQIFDEMINFDVIQQGSNDTLGLTAQKGINNDGAVVYRGDFTIEREDNVINVDGLARINPVFPSSCEDQGMGSDTVISNQFTRDQFNVMGENLTVASAENIDALSGFRQTVSGRVGVTLDIRSSEDPYFVFGDPNYSLRQTDGRRLGVPLKVSTVEGAVSEVPDPGPGGGDGGECIPRDCPPKNDNGQIFDPNPFVCDCVDDPLCIKIENCPPVPGSDPPIPQFWRVEQCKCVGPQGGG